MQAEPRRARPPALVILVGVLQALCILHLAVGDVSIVPGRDTHALDGLAHKLRVIQQPLCPTGRANK
eukprot:15763173-Heterocapsa_arctica.AAC.1